MKTDYIHELVGSLKKKYKTSNPFVLAERLNVNVRFKYLKDLKGFYTVSQEIDLSVLIIGLMKPCLRSWLVMNLVMTNYII